MSWLVAALGSSVGRKMIVALTGLALLGFVLAHMAGNLQVFVGREALNAYAQGLQDLGPLLWVARIGLLGMFGVHVVLALKLTAESKAARPQAYAHNVGRVQAGPAVHSMALTGATVLAFVAYHLAHFTLGVVHAEHRGVGLDEAGRHDVYGMVIAGFSDPLVAGLYLLAMALLSLHLYHGVSSTLRSLGCEGPRYAPIIATAGKGLAALVFFGNASIPLAILTGLVGGA